jgi:hypothetical protein
VELSFDAAIHDQQLDQSHNGSALRFAAALCLRVSRRFKHVGVFERAVAEGTAVASLEDTGTSSLRICRPEPIGDWTVANSD